MLDTDQVKRIPGREFTQEQADALTGALSEIHVGLATSVDMQDLKDAVKELAVAQTRSEARLEKVESRMDGVEGRMERVESSMEKVEGRMEGVEGRMDGVETTLAKTVEALQKLTEAHGETRTQLGGLSHTVGYILENEAYRALPALLLADHGIEMEGRLIRTYLTTDRGYPVEVNIFGKGRKNGREVVVLGESKSQLSAKGIDHFIQNRLRRLEPLFEDVLPVLVTHMITAPDVETYAQERGIALYYSYQF